MFHEPMRRRRLQFLDCSALVSLVLFVIDEMALHLQVLLHYVNLNFWFESALAVVAKGIDFVIINPSRGQRMPPLYEVDDCRRGQTLECQNRRARC
jgi:hypothetical protein